jgi:hypothetical protein
MTTNDDEYRTRLIEEVRRIQAQQEVKEMSDQQLEAGISSSLGLPAGTTFTEEQLEMIIKHRASASLSHQERSEDPQPYPGS